MNTTSIFMTPVARKFNLLRFFGNSFAGLRKELKEVSRMDDPPEDEFLSSMGYAMAVLTKVGILFVATTMLVPSIFMRILDILPWFCQWIFIVATVDYFNACLETYDEEPKGDE